MGAGRKLVANEVANWIRVRILDGRLAPGDRIKQEKIAIECGTSRIPVRDALVQLNNEGLVALTSYAGARVATLSSSELDEIYLLRECVEPPTLAASVPILSPRAVGEMELALVEMEKVPHRSNPSRWLELDREFHRASFAAAGMPEFLRLIEGFWNRTQQYRRAYTLLPESFETAHLEHRLLLDAIATGDADQAATISRLHIRRTRLALRDNSSLFEWNS